MLMGAEARVDGALRRVAKVRKSADADGPNGIPYIAVQEIAQIKVRKESTSRQDYIYTLPPRNRPTPQQFYLAPAKVCMIWEKKLHNMFVPLYLCTCV